MWVIVYMFIYIYMCIDKNIGVYVLMNVYRYMRIYIFIYSIINNHI